MVFPRWPHSPEQVPKAFTTNAHVSTNVLNRVTMRVVTMHSWLRYLIAKRTQRVAVTAANFGLMGYGTHSPLFIRRPFLDRMAMSGASLYTQRHAKKARTIVSNTTINAAFLRWHRASLLVLRPLAKD